MAEHLTHCASSVGPVL